MTQENKVVAADQATGLHRSNANSSAVAGGRDFPVAPRKEQTIDVSAVQPSHWDDNIQRLLNDPPQNLTPARQPIPQSAELPKVINLGHPTRKASGAGRKQPAVRPLPDNPAQHRSYRNIDWSTGSISVDNAKSAKWGLTLSQAMRAQGIGHFEKGDQVTIEAGVGPGRFELTGRASRKQSAYFWIDELAQAGIQAHQTINLVIVKVERAGIVIYSADEPQAQGGVSCLQ